MKKLLVVALMVVLGTAGLTVRSEAVTGPRVLYYVEGKTQTRLIFTSEEVESAPDKGELVDYPIAQPKTYVVRYVTNQFALDGKLDTIEIVMRRW